MKKFISHKTFKMLAIYVAFSLVAAIFGCISVTAQNGYTVASSYAGGVGTEASPYRVSNANQLYKMVMNGGIENGAPAYYELTDDISLNSIASWAPDKTNTANYSVWDIKGAVDFAGNFDGKGHTVSGLYSDCSGFITKTASGKTVRISNVIFKDCFVMGSSWTGTVIGISNGSEFTKVIVENTKLVSAAEWANTGALVGLVSDNTSISIVSCAVIKADTKGVFTGCGSWNSVTQNITNSFGVECTATKYSHATFKTSDAYIISDPSTIKGAVAEQTMHELDWELVWQAGNNGEYPKLQKGDGNTFSEGDGTKGSPFLISTSAQLKRMIIDGGKVDNTPAYYTLISDIELNDTANWAPDKDNTKKYKVWDVTGAADFAGYFNGNGHTISGLYTNGKGLITKTDSNAVPEITNLVIKNAYVCGTSWSGVLIGETYTAEFSRIIIENADVNTVTSWANTGTFTGIVHDGNAVTLTDCAVIGSNAKGIISGCGDWQAPTHRVNNFWSVECTATKLNCAKGGIVPNNVYIISEPDTVKGSAAKTAMPALDWDGIWKAGKGNKYPSLRQNGWDGKSANKPVLSDETKPNSAENPYEINTAAELYYVAKNYNTATGYYKLCSDIYLNDVTRPEQGEWWQADKLNNWYALDTDAALSDGFKGILDGDYYTVYGLYLDKKANDTLYSGIVPVLGNGGFVKNLNVTNAYIKAEADSVVAAIAGAVAENATAVIENVNIDTSVSITAKNAAGVVGVVGKSAGLTVNNTGIKAEIDGDSIAGAVSAKKSDATVSLVGCFTTSSKLTGFTATYIKCYQVGNSDIDGLTEVSCDDMKGRAVKIIGMPELDYDNVWLPKTEDYPTLRNPRNYGNEGSVWSGKSAEDYAINPESGKRGDGTKVNPYIIATAEQLYRMMTVREDGAYYELACDIYLNDTTVDKWYEATNTKQWFSNQGSSVEGKVGGGWKLSLEGNGFSINGLYTSAGGWNAAGFIPVAGDGTVITNVHIRNSYYKALSVAYGQKADNYIGGIVGYVAPSANVTIGGCTVDSTVIFSGGDSVGGILGASAGKALITYCGFAGNIESDGRFIGGIYGSVWSSTKINNCYSIGYVVGAKDDNIHATASKTYGTVSQENSPVSKKIVVAVLEKECFFEENANEHIDFDWNKWKFVQSYDYPFPVYSTDGLDGVAGGIWSGTVANNYAPYTSEYAYPDNLWLTVSTGGYVIDELAGDYYYGDGSKEYPYHIATGEQFAKMYKENSYNDPKMGYHNYFIVTEDIYLNDISEPNWYKENGVNDWISGQWDMGFRGRVDGQGHIVYGLAYVSEREWYKMGLFPVVGEGAVIERIGVVKAYIDNVTTDTYAGGIVGYVQQYGTYAGISNTKREDLEPNGLADPVIRECFASDCYISATSAGGIIGGIPAPITVEDCFFTGTVVGTKKLFGSMVGNCFAGSGALYVKSSYGISTNYDRPMGGSAALGSRVEGGYVYYSGKESLNKFKLKHPMNMYGKAAYEHLPEFFADGKDVWVSLDDGTPVLKVFGDRIKQYAFREPIYTTVSFTTNVENQILPSFTGVFGDPITLPIPSRTGYSFGGWYYYPEFQCSADDLNYIPRTDVTLYAKWIKECVTQDFENYANTKYDVNPDGDYQYFRIGLRDYTADYVHGGSKSMHRLGKTATEEDFLINYEELLTVGDEYEMTFWVCTDTDGTDATISLVQNTWPDINLSEEPAKSVNQIAKLKNLKEGEWKQYKYKFVAGTKWVSLRTTGNASLYIDDIVLLSTSKGVSSVPRTADESIPYKVLICSFLISAVICVTLRIRLYEVED